MADVPSSIVKLNDLEVAQNKPVSEQLVTKIAASINGLIDQDTTNSAAIATLESRVDNASNVVLIMSDQKSPVTDLSWTEGTISSGTTTRPTNIFLSEDVNFTVVRYGTDTGTLQGSVLDNTARAPGRVPAFDPTILNIYNSSPVYATNSSRFSTLSWKTVGSSWGFLWRIFEISSV